MYPTKQGCEFSNLMRYIAVLLACYLAFAYGYKAEYQTEKIPQDYKTLVEYAHIAAIAYCLEKESSPGIFGDDDSNCLLEICKTKPYESLAITGRFKFNTWGEACSGYYAIDHETKRILLVFRGTASRRDWLRNMDIFPVEYIPIFNNGIPLTDTVQNIDCDNCKVHRGYYKVLKKHCGSIIQGVLALHDEHLDYKLVVVGHSLGGALAVLSGVELRLMGYDPLVVSYASPKVGNKDMAEYIDRIFSTSEVAEYICENRDFETGYIRVVHKGDMIPKLPPTSIYQHCGFEYTINKKYFPHKSDDIEPKGMSSLDDQYIEGQVSIAKFNYNKLWSDNVGKYEHNNYFIGITKCQI